MYRTFSYLMFYGKEQALFYTVIMYVVMIILAVELIRSILKLIYEKKKREISKKEIPILLADKDSLGENTVYKRTISSSLPRITTNDENFTEQLHQKSRILLDNTQDGALTTSFGVAVPSTSERTDATQSVLDRNITRKSRMKTTKSSHKKSIKGTSINTSKDKGANIKKNLKLEISMPLEQTQVESISERRTKEYEDKAEAKH